MELPDLLQDLATQGELDSEGEFTLGLQKALDKLSRFQSSTPHRFLVQIVAAGIASGASRAIIRRDTHTTQARFPDAELSESPQGGDLRKALSSGGATYDLLLGCLGALAEGALSVSCEIASLGEAYLWRLDKAGSVFEDLSPDREPGLFLSFQWKQATLVERARSWYLGVKGYGGMTPECRRVDQECAHSLTPISINDQPINRPYFTRQAPVGVCVGEEEPPLAGRCLKREAEDWSGSLVLAPGELLFVVHGVGYPQRPIVGLSGMVRVNLERDATREKVLENNEWEALRQELEQVRADLVNVFVGLLAMVEDRVHASMFPLVWAAIERGELSEKRAAQALNWWTRYADESLALTTLESVEDRDLGSRMVARLTARFGPTPPLAEHAKRFTQL